MAKMVHRQPFYAAVALQLPIIEDKKCKTAATDGRRIYYNPKFMTELDDNSRIFVMAHEAMHVAHLHPFRKQGRDHYVWNVACDYVINAQLVESGFIMPSCGLLDTSYNGMSEEQVYDRLIEQCKQSNPSDGDGDSGPFGNLMDEVMDVSDMSKDEQAKAEQEIKAIVMSACKQAKAMGRLPAAFEGWIENLMHPALPWDALLREFFTSLARNDYSWARPNRRYLAQNMCLPSLNSRQLGVGVLAMDTSGSVGDEDLSKFMSEIDHIWTVLKPERVVVAQSDCEVGEWREYEPGETIDRKIKCRGGTSFIPVFDRVETDGLTPQFLVYFTDGDGSFPEAPPSYPVLWVMTTDIQPPWGTVVRL